ncbi:hypothetical protein DFH06DRAFT_370997 [Mycena polygramma]|nr:hypothetical protein DFH06DRAFT_370997 [Mycena polygramma]
MVELYSLIKDVDFLDQKTPRLKNTLTEITRQTLEFSLFIREYTGHGFTSTFLIRGNAANERSGSGRLIRGALSSDMTNKIKGFDEAFQKLKSSYDRGLATQAVFFSAKTQDDLQTLVQSDMLKLLEPHKFNAVQRPQCLAGTCQEILTNITEWVATPSEGSNILWLHSVAGAGKSTISATIAESFRSLRRLGAFLFFDRNDPAGSDPGGVIRTIAHSMATSDVHIRKAVCAALMADPTLPTAHMHTQFHKLLLEPLVAAYEEISGPIIIILDALDECGNLSSRESLVSLIINEFHKIPAIFRFLIASRPDSDIAGRFHESAHIVALQLNIGLG